MASGIGLLEKASARGYEPGAHREKDSKPTGLRYKKKTLKSQRLALERYEEWRSELAKNTSLPPPPKLEEGAIAPDIGTIKDFFRCHAAVARGMLDEERRMTADSLCSFGEWFFGGFARETGTTVDEEVRKSSYEWVRTDLVQEKVVVTKKRKKRLFAAEEWAGFNKAIWSVHSTMFVHPRTIVQSLFITSVFCWTGARIGAFFEKGLCYGDIELTLVPKNTGGWKVIYKINQRWVKNNQDPENVVFGASTSQHEVPLYDDTAFLLAMAIADNAINGISSVKDLNALEIPDGEQWLILRWNESAESLPILRQVTQANGVTLLPMSAQQYTAVFKATCVVMGISKADVPTVHAMRRACGKKVDESYTIAQRSQHITHNDPNVFGQSYMANTSSVDGRSAFLDEPLQHDHVKFFQSFARFREKGLPVCLPAAIKDQVEGDQALVELVNSVQLLRNQHASSSAIEAASRKVTMCRRHITNKKLVQYQKQWVKERRDWKVKTRGKQKIEDYTKNDLCDVLCVIMPEYGRLAASMVSNRAISASDRGGALADLYTYITRDMRVLYRPGEEPIHNMCAAENCSMDMNDIRKTERSTHIHDCRHKEEAQKSGRSTSEHIYCYTCFLWFVEEDWNAHCKSHLDHISSKRCGAITYCATLLRPALCPFCLGNEDIPPSKRWITFTRDTSIRNHLVTEHLKSLTWPLICPHPLCKEQKKPLPDLKTFSHHLHDEHDLNTERVEAILQKDACMQRPYINSNLQDKKRKLEDSDLQLPSSRKMRLPSLSTSETSLLDDSNQYLPGGMPSLLLVDELSDLPAVERQLPSPSDVSESGYDTVFSRYIRSPTPPSEAAGRGNDPLQQTLKDVTSQHTHNQARYAPDNTDSTTEASIQNERISSSMDGCSIVEPENLSEVRFSAKYLDAHRDPPLQHVPRKPRIVLRLNKKPRIVLRIGTKDSQPISKAVAGASGAARQTKFKASNKRRRRKEER